MSLTESARALLAQAQAERATLGARREAIIAEREARLSEVREEFYGRLTALDEELALVDRLRKALDPEGVKAERAALAAAKKSGNGNGRGPGRPAKEPTGPTWRPNDDTLAQVLAAFNDGTDTVGSAAKATGISRASVDRAAVVLRDDGLTRLAGTGQFNAKKYKLTPEGKEWLAQRGGVVDGAIA